MFYLVNLLLNAFFVVQCTEVFEFFFERRNFFATISFTGSVRI